MSRENVQLAYRAIDAFNRRDLDALLALMDDDVVAVARAAAMEGGQYHGHDGIRRWWREQLDVFPDFMVEVREVRDHGDVTVAVLHNRAHGAGSETPAEETIWSVVRWRRGKVVWSRNLSTEAEAFEAVGLSE